ncbi:NADP-dependent oxidoreductase [Burkholderia sp. AU30280]|uniref:MDR family NADP-dependent oxidoreductase n=1 Tax=Burkholderia sp. AU30280 TaxID=2879628 RepID=UPI001CF56DA2|nr:NADP-dependent oxidoreductase [Burkholderia sp. AU30280]MCA8277600.1 NADP-dependent oxidoreductase [Burkholderia sp. AU30280]
MDLHPRVSRQVQLATHPDGTLQSAHFSIVETSLPPLAPHQVLLRNRWFRISVSTRLMSSRDAKEIKGIPFPPLKPGDALADAAIGEVIAAGPESGLQVGEIVLHPLGWRDYAVVDAHRCEALPGEGLDAAAYLGHGSTAYAALTRGIQIKRGDTVLVSSGAGAIGSMAGQIARRLGAGRVIGSTRSPDKAAWMRRELGYDAVIVRDGSPFVAQLADAAPDGIDVFVDMVGGEQLSAAVGLAREGARFVILGALVAELSAEHASSIAPAEIDTFRLPIKGITLRGYSACEDDPGVIDEWLDRLHEWRQASAICLPCTTFRGLDNAPAALQEACAGRLKGVVLVEL